MVNIFGRTKCHFYISREDVDPRAGYRLKLGSPVSPCGGHTFLLTGRGILGVGLQGKSCARFYI
jgi:hypothetical protein